MEFKTREKLRLVWIARAKRDLVASLDRQWSDGRITIRYKAPTGDGAKPDRSSRWMDSWEDHGMVQVACTCTTQTLPIVTVSQDGRKIAY